MKHFELNCTCGNTTHTDGFYPCDNNGNETEPTKDWNGLYLCGRCGKIHNTNTEPTQRIFYDEATERVYTLSELEEGYNKTAKNNTLFKEEYPIFNNYLFEALSKNGTLTELTTKDIISVVPCGWGIYKDNNNTQYISLTSGKLENQNTGVLCVPYERDKNENVIKIIEL